MLLAPLLIASALSLLALGFTFSRRRFIARATRVDGEVVDNRQRTTRSQGRKRVSWHGVIAYSVAGRRFELETKVGSMSPRHRVGERVQVLVQADAPDDAIIGTGLELWFLPIFVSAFAAAGWIVVVLINGLGQR